MIDPIDPSELTTRFPHLKWIIIVLFALGGAIMQRDSTWVGRILAFSIGILMAVVFSDPIKTIFSLGSTWGDAISAILALTGKNLADYFIRASKDPTTAVSEILDIWRKPRS